MNPYSYDLLKRSFQNATFVDVSSLIARIRAVKSPAEIECMRQAARFTVAGIDAAVQALRSGTTENTLAAAGSEAMIAGRRTS